jgi:hypothetical protein
MIQVVCPSCAKRMRFRDDLAGKSGRCPNCEASITVPLLAVDLGVVLDVPAPAGVFVPAGPAPSAPGRLARLSGWAGASLYDPMSRVAPAPVSVPETAVSVPSFGRERFVLRSVLYFGACVAFVIGLAASLDDARAVGPAVHAAWICLAVCLAGLAVSARPAS